MCPCERGSEFVFVHSSLHVFSANPGEPRGLFQRVYFNDELLQEIGDDDEYYLEFTVKALVQGDERAFDVSLDVLFTDGTRMIDQQLVIASASVNSDDAPPSSLSAPNGFQRPCLRIVIGRKVSFFFFFFTFVLLVFKIFIGIFFVSPFECFICREVCVCHKRHLFRYFSIQTKMVRETIVVECYILFKFNLFCF